MREIFFVSQNKNKLKEVVSFFEAAEPTVVSVTPYQLKIQELQSQNLEEIAEDKARKAFAQIRRPLFVEHTGLYIKNFGDLPGGLTQIVWDNLKAKKFCEYFGNNGDTAAAAKTVIAYCDGKKIKLFTGVIEGKIAGSPSQDEAEFEWDCVFIPDNYQQTFAQLKEEKQKISMRIKALTDFRNYLQAQKT